MNIVDFCKAKYNYIKPYMTNAYKTCKKVVLDSYTIIRSTYVTKEFLATHKQELLKYGIPCLVVLLLIYSCSISQREINKNVSDLFRISDEIRAHFANKPDYWKLSNQYVLDAKILPSKYTRANRLVLSGNKVIYVGSGVNGDIVMPGENSFDIALPNLNKSECISYTESIISEENLMKLVKISIYNLNSSYTFEWGGVNPLPIQKYATKDFCKKSDNIVVWTLK